jgi:hypothetical protein
MTAILVTAATLTAQKQAPPPPEPSEAARPGATTLRVEGTIAGYDHETRLLALSTTSGLVHFDVPDSARIRLAGRKIERRLLVSLGGYEAAVHYSAAGGHTTLRSVDVFDKKERTRP